MKKIEVVLEGTAPLLMHSAEGMEEQKVKKNPAKNYNAEDEAEKVAYRNKEGNLIIPSRCIKASILNAASWLKVGKKSMKPIIAGCTRINPYDIEITNKKGVVLKDYEIDKRPVVVQRARILRARPRIDEWQIKFELVYNEDMLGNSVDSLRQVIEDAGQRIGLLDNRPQKYGENGTFEVKSFKPIE